MFRLARLRSLVAIGVVLFSSVAVTPWLAQAVAPASTITTTSEPAITTGGVNAFAFVGTHVWTASDYGAVVEINPAATTGRQIVAKVSGLNGRVKALAASGTNLWVLTEGASLYRINTVAVDGPTITWTGTGYQGAPYRNVQTWQLQFIGTKLYLFNWVSLIELDTSGSGAPTQTQSLNLNTPYAITSDGSHLWVTSQCGACQYTTAEHGAVLEIDPNAIGGMAIVHTYDSGGEIATYVTKAFGSVWVLNLGDTNDPNETRKVVRINPSTGAVIANIENELLARVSVGPQANLVAVGSEFWLTASGYSQVLRIDTQANTTAGAFYAPFDQPWAIGNDGTHVWISQINNVPRVAELNVTNLAAPTVIAEIEHGYVGISRPGQSTVVDGNTWVANGTGTISVVNPLANGGPKIVSTVQIGINTVGIYYDGTYVWASDGQESGSVLQVDPHAVGGPAVLATIGGFSYPTAITSDGSHIWVVNQGFYYSPGPGGVSEIDPNAPGGPAVVHWVQTDKGGNGLYFDGTYLYMSVIAWGGGMTVINPKGPSGPVVVADYLTLVNRAMTLDAENKPWLINNTDKTIEQISISPTTANDVPTVVKTVSFSSIDTGLSVASIAFDGVHIWAGLSAWTKGYIVEIDAESGAIMQSIRVNDGTTGWYYPKSIFANGQFAIASMADNKTVLYATVPTPDKPQSVVATPVDSGVDISWSQPAHTGIATIDSYSVSVETVSANAQATSAGVRATSTVRASSIPGCTQNVGGSSSTTHSCSIRGLTNGVTYKFTVQATNSIGRGLAVSVLARPVAAVPTPTTTTAPSTTTTTTTTTTQPATTATNSSTSTTVATGSTTTSSPQKTPTSEKPLPVTGSNATHSAVVALWMLLFGIGVTALRKKKRA